MSQANRDHVALRPDRDVMFWEFIVPSRVKTCEAQATEMVSLFERLFETFGSFFVPTEITYAIGRFPPGQRLPVDVNVDEYRGHIRRELRDESGITVEAFRESARIDGSEARWIPRIEFDETEVTVRLEQGDVAASKHKNTVSYRKGEPVEDAPAQDPLDLSALHGQNTGRYNTDAEYVTSFVVAPMSDIWFENTEIGATNRRYLTAFLERIEAALPVVDVERTSEWVPLSDLEAVY
ncbi:hypothetical protein [Halovivax cerinus]|uniref:Uncharacterized protein n=1 Tax=Halovivax cerinus TaxID=1487865 RepID=A0ABD5NRE8_9EURY|nr:hypothetical protein [Halovivax cerinus]